MGPIERDLLELRESDNRQARIGDLGVGKRQYLEFSQFLSSFDRPSSVISSRPDKASASNEAVTCCKPASVIPVLVRLRVSNWQAP